MSVTLTEEGILDLIKTTRPDEGTGRFNQIAQPIQNYEFFKRIMRKESDMIHGGTHIERDVMTGLTDSARAVGLHASDSISQVDVMAKINVPWRRFDNHVCWEVREFLENAGDNKRIQNLLKIRRAAMRLSWAIKLETQFWSKPTDSNDKLNMWGVPQWVCWVDNEDGDFVGGDPVGFSDGAGGLPVSQYETFQNFSGTYGAVTPDDLLWKVRRAMDLTNWQSPVDVDEFRRKGGPGQMLRCYTDQETKQEIEDNATAQNDNNGRVIGNMDGVTTIRSSPLIYAAQLNNSRTGLVNPFYMLNFNYLGVAFLKGDFFRVTKAEKVEGKHNTIAEFEDVSCNTFCVDRRVNSVFAKAAA